MATKPVDERVKEIIVEQLGVEAGDVTPAAKFIEDMGADSLDTVELVMAFEEEFDIKIPDEQAEKIKTVGEAIEYISSKGGRPLATGDRSGARWTVAGVRVAVTGLGGVNAARATRADLLGRPVGRPVGHRPHHPSSTPPPSRSTSAARSDGLRSAAAHREEGRPAARPLRPVRDGLPVDGGRGLRDRLRQDRPVPAAGCLIGSGIGGIQTSSRTSTKLLRAGARPRSRPSPSPCMIVNTASGQLSIHYGLKGPNSVGGHRLRHRRPRHRRRLQMIQHGEADVMLAGRRRGRRSRRMGLAGFCAMKAMSNTQRRAHPGLPALRRRPRRLRPRRRRRLSCPGGARARPAARSPDLRARSLGYGITADAHHITAPDPEGDGAARAMRRR